MTTLSEPSHIVLLAWQVIPRPGFPIQDTLPETGSLPSARWFAECCFSGTRQSRLCRVFFLTLGKEALCRVFFLTLGKEALCRLFFLTLGKEALCRLFF